MKIATATSFWQRTRGLLGTYPSELNFDALHLIPCKSIHTFGMHYTIDIAFLNCHNRIIHTRYGIAPNRLCHAPKLTASVLERPTQESPWEVDHENLSNLQSKSSRQLPYLLRMLLSLFRPLDQKRKPQEKPLHPNSKSRKGN